MHFNIFSKLFLSYYFIKDTFLKFQDIVMIIITQSKLFQITQNLTEFKSATSCQLTQQQLLVPSFILFFLLRNRCPSNIYIYLSCPYGFEQVVQVFTICCVPTLVQFSWSTIWCGTLPIFPILIAFSIWKMVA